MHTTNTKNLAVFLLLLQFASVFVSAQYGVPYRYGWPTLLLPVGNSLAPCKRIDTIPDKPLNCSSLNSEGTYVLFTGGTSVIGDWAYSPTVPTALMIYNGGPILQNGCSTKNSTTMPSGHTDYILCNGSNAWPWIQVIKQSGVWGTAIYPNDVVAIYNNRTGKYCGGESYIHCDYTDLNDVPLYVMSFSSY